MYEPTPVNWDVIAFYRKYALPYAVIKLDALQYPPKYQTHLWALRRLKSYTSYIFNALLG